jgi:signal transduction histidine kinase
LFVTYRELGFNINFRENGPSIELVDSASLVVYRIVSETLANTRQHAPVNTGIDVDFIWTDIALQILIKDNGEETSKANAADTTGYSVADDQQALTQRPTGAGLDSLAEMVHLYDATIEFARVPGVGFKVSAAFPNVVKYRKVK